MSVTANDQIVNALVSIVTSLATSIGVTVGTLATQISSQATADTGMTAQTKDFLNKIATAIQATSPSSSIRNSLYSA